MDELLYLEPDEEITSVIDKLKHTAATSVGLVIPRNSTLIHSIVNLKLLKKEAQQHGKEIALVTGDKIGKNIASQVGIQVYEDVHAKRPTNPYTLPPLPKGDEVIEVDMTGGEPAKASGEGGAKVNYYQGSKPVSHNELTFEEQKSPPPKSAQHYVSESKHAAHLKEPTPRPALKQTGKKGLIIFLTFFLVVILGTLLGLPQSSILVTVAAESFEKTIPVTIDKSVNRPASEDRVMPGKLLEVGNDDARRVVATGKKDVGGKAKGAVTVTNAWDSNPIKFSAGTTLTSADGKTFTLANDVTVPGATATLHQGQLVATPGTATAQITATEPGETYNIKPTRFAISGLSSEKQAKIYAESTKDLTGGFTKQVSVMTQADIDAAKDALAKDLAKEATDQLTKSAKGQKLIEEAIVHEIVSAETNPQAPDTETDYFDIKVKARHQVMVFDEKSLDKMVNEAIRKEVPADKELLLGEGDEFVVGVASTEYSSGKLMLESKIKTKVGTRIDPKQAKQGLAGKNEAAIREKLQTLPNVKEVAVYTFPSFWWQDTSFVPWNTRLKIVYE